MIVINRLNGRVLNDILALPHDDNDDISKWRYAECGDGTYELILPNTVIMEHDSQYDTTSFVLRGGTRFSVDNDDFVSIVIS